MQLCKLLLPDKTPISHLTALNASVTTTQNARLEHSNAHRNVFQRRVDDFVVIRQAVELQCVEV